MARGEEYKSKDGSTNLNSHLIKAFVKCLKDDFRMFVQFQGDGKESLDKEYTRAQIDKKNEAVGLDGLDQLLGEHSSSLS
ncbi:hypothetical protein Tco_1039581 [Tanacetum coccineum]